MYLHYISTNNWHDCNFIHDRPLGVDGYLLLYIKSRSSLILNGYTHIINAPSVILLDSYTPHKYFPSGTEYIDDYLHFSVKDPATFSNQLTFPFNTPIPISNDSSIHPLLNLILIEFESKKKYSGPIINSLITALLFQIGNVWDFLKQEDTLMPHYADLLNIRSQILKNPEKLWTIEKLAEDAHLSVAYFQVLYKKAFGITCINEVINTKLSVAKTYLSSTNLPISQIALELGYTETSHFIRQFKKSTGVTPGTFRKNNTQP